MSEQEEKKSLVLSTRHVYVYRYRPALHDLPTFLFLHGFPSTSEIWNKVADRLLGLGFGILRPDLLGYGETSKPTGVHDYSLRKMSSEIVEILAHHRLVSVIGVGHGLGSALLTRIWWYHPQYLARLAFLGAGYALPTPLHLDYHINKFLQKYGMDIGGYWLFLSSEEAPRLLNANIPSTMSIFFSKDPGLWNAYLLPRGGLQDWIARNRYSPSSAFQAQSHADGEIKQSINLAFIRGGFDGPLNWYKAIRQKVDRDDEMALTQSRWVIRPPVLFLVGDHDAMGRPDIVLAGVEESKRSGFLLDARSNRIINASHWMMIEEPEAVSGRLRDLAASVILNELRLPPMRP